MCLPWAPLTDDLNTKINLNVLNVSPLMLYSYLWVRTHREVCVSFRATDDANSGAFSAPLYQGQQEDFQQTVS